MAHAGGRPLKFKTVAELQEKIDDYFKTVVPKQYTITGLAIALDVDRDTLVNYQDRPEYFGTVKSAKTRIEYGYELSLREQGRSGDIFALKNFGWVDKTEQDITTAGEKIESNPIDANMLTQFLMTVQANTKR